MRFNSSQERHIRARFQSFELDLATGELWKGGSAVRLPPQPAKVLVLLVERAGSLVSREEVQKTLWNGETFVDFDQGLNYCIRQIRIALEDNADQPLYVATVPRRGYRFVAEVVRVPDPEPEPPAVAPAQHAEGTASPIAEMPGRGRRPRLLHPVFMGAAAVALLAAVVGYALWRGGLVKILADAAHRNGATDTIIPRRTSVAVLGFANLDGKPADAWLSTALSEMLSTELAQGGTLRLISGEEVAKARPVLQLPENLSRETMARLRQQLGADVLLLGSYAVVEQSHARKIRVDLRLEDARNGELLASFAQSGEEGALFDLVERSGATLRQKLGASALSATDEASVSRSFPSDADARKYYAEGLGKLRRFDSQGARESLELALKIEPQFAPARSALAAALASLGYDAQATEEAAKAAQATAGLPREEQLSIEARAYETAQDRTKAAETLKMLFGFYPDNLDYGIRLATVQMQADATPEALKTLARMRNLAAPLGASPRLDLLESQIRTHDGDFKPALEKANTAVQKSQSAGSQLLTAQALLAKAVALERLGQPEASLAASTEAKNIDTDANFARGVGVALLIGGDALSDKGDLTGAREHFENGLALFQEVGDKKNQAMALERIGNTYHDQGKFAESRNAYSRALDIYRTVGWKYGISSALGNLANTLDALGDLKGSMKMHQDARALFEETGQKRGLASELDNIGGVYEEMGNLQAALDAFNKSLALQRQIGYRRGEMYALSSMADVLLKRNDLEGARAHYQAARAIAVDTHEDGETARADLALAGVDFYQQRLSQAESVARRAAAQLQTLKDPEDAAAGYAVLARILLAEKRPQDAVAAGKQAESLLAEVTDWTVQFEVGLALADVEAGTGKPEAAERRLRSLLERARGGGYQLYILEIRWRMARLETGASRQRALATVADEARRIGFELIAAEATRSGTAPSAH